MSEAMNNSPDFGDSAKDKWLREQTNWDDVEHLIREGKILSLVYDIETTDLDTTTAALTQFSGKIVDAVQGRIIDEIKLDIRVPEDVAISPQAAIVTQSKPRDLYSNDRMPAHIAAAHIIQFFRNPYRSLWDKLGDEAYKIIANSTNEGEEARVYTLTSPDGTKSAQIRLHQGGKYLSIRYPDKVDYLCDALQTMPDSSSIAEAIAGMVGAEVRDIYDIEGRCFDRPALEKVIRSYDKNKIDTLLKSMKEKLGDRCPPALHHIPKDDRLPNGANSYYDNDGKRWKRFAAPAMTKGHNIINFDDRMLWQAFHRTLSDDIFITHIKNYQRFRVDTFHLARLVALLDQDGENGFKSGTKIDKRTGQPYESFGLSELMEANTREANPERGIDEGVRMPDGSKYDRSLAHQDASYDVDATIALDAYMRKRAHKVVRLIEQNTDFERFKHFLIGGEGFETHPLRAFARKGFPEGAQLNIGVCVAIDEEIKEMRKAIMVRTDTDQKLEDFAYRIHGESKKLTDMTTQELASMLTKQAGRPDALFEVINMRKNPPVLPAEMAFERGIGGDPEKHEANRRFILANEGFCKRLLEAYQLSHKSIPDFREIPNPQPEDHLFTRIAEVKHYETDIDGKKALIPEAVRNEHAKALRSNRKFDETLYRAIKPHMIECEERIDTLEAFISRMQKVDGSLKECLETKHIPLPSFEKPQDASAFEKQFPEEPYPFETSAWNFKVLPAPDKPFMPKKYDRVPDPDKPGKTKNVLHEVSPQELAWLTGNAVEYLWKLRCEFMYEFLDTTNRYTVQDRFGHDIDWALLHKMKQSDLADRIRTGAYRIHMEELGGDGWSTELVARMFRDAGRIEWVKDYLENQGRVDEVRDWQTWEEYFAALRALRFNGPPHIDPDNHKGMSARKGLKEAARIRNNIRSGGDDIRAQDDEWGAWDVFMRNQDSSEQILAEYDALAQEQLAQNPFTDAQKRLMGYDPKTGMPIEYAPYKVPLDADSITIDVPDRMLDAPLYHHDVANNVLMLNPTNEQRSALATAKAGTVIYLRGEQSGRTFLAAKPRLLTAREIEPTPYFHEVYAAAATRFEDSGVEPPAAGQFIALAVEKLAPIASEIEPDVQAIKMPRWEDFMATVSPELGNRYEKLTGLVIRHENFTPTIGKARLQGMIKDKRKPGLSESGWELTTQIAQVRTMTLQEAKDRIRSKAFTHEDALHYGYAGLNDMQSKLSKLFEDTERAPDRADNLIHFIDIDPADKSQMRWHQPAKRSLVELVKDGGPPPPPESKPDPSQVHGKPDIERAPEEARQRA